MSKINKEDEKYLIMTLFNQISHGVKSFYCHEFGILIEQNQQFESILRKCASCFNLIVKRINQSIPPTYMLFEEEELVIHSLIKGEEQIRNKKREKRKRRKENSKKRKQMKTKEEGEKEKKKRQNIVKENEYLKRQIKNN